MAKAKARSKKPAKAPRARRATTPMRARKTRRAAAARPQRPRKTRRGNRAKRRVRRRVAWGVPVTPPPFRDDSITDPAQQRFLKAYVVEGSISAAAAAAGINRCTHYAWSEAEVYAKAFAQAQEAATDFLEQVGRAMAIGGNGAVLQFLLKGLRPEVYRDRHEVSGPGGQPVMQTVMRVIYSDKMNPGPTPNELGEPSPAQTPLLPPASLTP